MTGTAGARQVTQRIRAAISVAPCRQWVPVTSTPPLQSRVRFPSALEFKRFAQDDRLMFPVPKKRSPCKSASVSNRVLWRRDLRLRLWRFVYDFIATVNQLSCGRAGHRHTRAQRREKLAVALPCAVSQPNARFH